MRVNCVSNSGKNLSKKALSGGNTTETKFNLDVGQTYMVYGISLWEDNVLYYFLIGKDENLPSWYPSELFETSDSLLPFEWYYNHLGYNETSMVTDIWGYKELALEPNHLTELIEREKESIKVFLNRKKEIDEYFER
jgi:hypothetical protein